MNIVKSILAHSDQTPSRPALHYKSGNEWNSYTWLEFRERVAKTANALRAMGIQPLDAVGIYSENSADWIIMDMAVLSIGAVTVPVFATNTADQARYIVDHAEMKVILVGNQQQYDNVLEIYADNQFLQKIIIANEAVKPVSESSVLFSAFMRNASTELEILDRDKNDLATLIYTSGTTGEPKGVMLAHEVFGEVIKNHVNVFGFKNFDREISLAFLPLSHVFERCWTILMLSLGAQVYFLENPKTIAEELKIVRPTTMCSVPRLYQKIYTSIHDKMSKSSAPVQKLFNWAVGTGRKVAELKRTGQQVPTALRMKYALADRLVFQKIKAQMGGRLWFMPVGGAALAADITAFFDAIGIHLVIGYGLTETSATVTAFPPVNYVYGSAGKPMGVQIRIGEQDEIQVKGKTILQGYYKKPEETAAVFTEDGWFKTGDAGRIDADNNLYIVDRIKDLMKTSTGKYISPQPIENLFAGDHFIQQIVVIGDNRPYVTALIVPNFEALIEKAQQLKLNFESMEELIGLEHIKEFYHEKINALQGSLAAFEKIKKIRLLPADFEMTSGEITPTLKIRRKIIAEKFAVLIEEMYLV